MKKITFLIFMLVWTAVLAIDLAAYEPTPLGPCQFQSIDFVMRLQGDCVTTGTIDIPDGFTLEGNGYTIYAEDVTPPFYSFVISASGGKANVNNIKIDGSGLSPDRCPFQPVMGINYFNTSGTISNSEIKNMYGGTACNWGWGIFVNSVNSPQAIRVIIDDNNLVNYRRQGILARGVMEVAITNNTLDGVGPVGFPVKDGIWLIRGATGMIKRNTIKNHFYTDPDNIAGAIFVSGGNGRPFAVGVQIQKNSLINNDVGIAVLQRDSSSVPAPVQTNVKVVNNTISNDQCNRSDQLGIFLVGNNDKIINNTISGDGYDSDECPGADTIGTEIFFGDLSHLLVNAKIHAND